MAFRPYTLWIDIEGNRLVQGPANEATIKPLQFIQGDTAQIELHALKRVDGTLTETYFPAGSVIKVGIGSREKNPVSGTFTLGYGALETEEIPYNASASQIETALNSINDVQSEGGVSVSVAGDGFIIKWITGITHSDITSNADGLFPKSHIRITALDSDTEQSVFLHLAQSVIAFSDEWDAMPVSVSNTDDVIPYADGSKVTRFSITNEPNGGYVNISVLKPALGTLITLGTITVPVFIRAADLKVLIRSVLTEPTELIDVVKTDEFVWDVTFSSNIYLAIISESIISSKGRYGTLSLNTAEVHTLLSGNESDTAIMEVNVLTDDGEQTILQTEVSIFSDVIDSATLDPLVLETPLGEQTANNRFVRRDSTQSSSNLEINNVWLNIGVSKIGTDVADAINSSDTPSASNPFSTQSWVQSQGYLTTPFDPTGYATESWVQSQGYVTTSFDPTGYATESWVQSQGYLTSAPPPSLSNLSTDISWDAYSNSGRLLIEGVIETSPTFTSARLHFGTSNPNSPENGDFWFNGTRFCYGGSGSIMYVADQDWVSALLSNYQTVYGMSAYAQKAGSTFTGKVNFTSVSGAAGLNVGIGGTSTSATSNGDLWISTGGTNLNFRDGTGSWRILVNTSNTNVFSASQVIDTTASTPALRVTQKGTGASLLVEDSVNPDGNAFVVDTNGNLGVGVDPSSWSASNKVEVIGAVKAQSITFDGTAQFKVTGTQTHGTGADTHDLLISFNGSTYRIPMIFVSTP